MALVVKDTFICSIPRQQANSMLLTAHGRYITAAILR